MLVEVGVLTGRGFQRLNCPCFGNVDTVDINDSVDTTSSNWWKDMPQEWMMKVGWHQLGQGGDKRKAFVKLITDVVNVKQCAIV